MPREVSNKILERFIAESLFNQITGQNVLKIKPALVIAKDAIDLVIGILKEAFKEFLRA